MCLYDIKVITGMSVGDLRTGQLDNRIMTVQKSASTGWAKVSQGAANVSKPPVITLVMDSRVNVPADVKLFCNVSALELPTDITSQNPQENICLDADRYLVRRRRETVEGTAACPVMKTNFL